MSFFGYPIEIWIGAIIAVIIKLKSAKRLNWIGACITVFVGVGAGLILYQPAMELLGLAKSWEVVVAILLSLSAENLMKVLVELSSDKDWIKTLITTKVEK
jgi:ABC-type uncharacterized transport system permease subunit